MAGTSRDAKLTLSVEALGQEDITKLEKSLRDLAAQGESSADEFGALADQVAETVNALIANSVQNVQHYQVKPVQVARVTESNAT